MSFSLILKLSFNSFLDVSQYDSFLVYQLCGMGRLELWPQCERKAWDDMLVSGKGVQQTIFGEPDGNHWNFSGAI